MVVQAVWVASRNNDASGRIPSLFSIPSGRPKPGFAYWFHGGSDRAGDLLRASQGPWLSLAAQQL